MTYRHSPSICCPWQTRTVLLVGALIGALTLPRPLTGQAQAPLFGTWTLNLAKSTYSPGPPPFKRATYKIEPWEKDAVRITQDMVRPRGGIAHFEWTGRFDGRDYALQGIEDYAVSNAYRQLDDRTFEVVQKVDGAEAITSRMTISPDGRTLTMVRSGSTVVYDKQ